jgi:hypothetical protein
MNFGPSGAIKKQDDFADFSSERHIRNTNGTLQFAVDTSCHFATSESATSAPVPKLRIYRTTALRQKLPF